MIKKAVLSGEPFFNIFTSGMQKNTFPETFSENGLTKAFQCDTIVNG